MANELSISASVSGSKNGLQLTASGSRSATLAGSNLFSNMQPIGTTAEQIYFPADLTDITYLFTKNLDAANPVVLGLDSGASTQKFCNLEAGDFMLIKLPTGSTPVYAKATGGTVNLQIIAFGT